MSPLGTVTSEGNDWLKLLKTNKKNYARELWGVERKIFKENALRLKDGMPDKNKAYFFAVCKKKKHVILRIFKSFILKDVVNIFQK